MQKFSIILCLVAFVAFSSLAVADLKIIDNTADFNKMIEQAQVPVVVQFSAYWCGPCKKLKATLIQVAPEFKDSEILVCYVDAYVNTELKKYLDGGYPTTRVFNKGKMGAHFVGSRPASFVRDFLNKTKKNPNAKIAEAGKFVVLNNVEEFNKAVQGAKVPAVVQFSAAWCSPCQKLKKTFIKIAPDYDTSKVRLYYVDADINKELKKYLKGGYPTIRVFTNGKMGQANFVGNKPESQVRSFIDGLISKKREAGKFIVLNNVEEFNKAIKDKVPAVVQFSAAWCSPCQKLKKTFIKIAPDYDTSKVRLYYVDADINKELKKYLKGGYPTIRVFTNSKMGQANFVGNKPESQVRSFIDGVIK